MAGHKAAAPPTVDPAARDAAIAAAGGAPPEMGGSPDDTVQMYRPDGSSVQVPANQVAAAFQSGQLGFAGGQKIAVKRGSQVLQADASDADQIFHPDSGFQVAGQKELAAAQEKARYGGIGGQAATVGVNALDALALGAGKGLAVDAAGLVSPGAQEATRSTLQALDRQNPISATVGQGIGIAAPLLVGDVGGLAGGAARTAGAGVRAADAVGGLAARGAEALVGTGAETLLGRAAQKAASLGARGAAEGAIYGTGSAYTQNALDEGDHVLTAEKLLAGAKGGAIAGGVIGSALGGGGTLIAGGVEKLADAVLPKIQERLEEFAQGRAFKAAGGSKSFLTKAMDRAGGAEEISRDLLERGHITPGATIESIAASTSKDAAEQGQKLSGLIQSLDQAGATIDPSKFASRAWSEVIAPLDKLPGYESVASKVTDYLESFVQKTRGQPVPLGQAWEMRKGLDDLIYRGTRPFAEPSPAIKEMRAMRGIMEDEITQAGEKTAQEIGGSFAPEYKETKRLYSSLRFASDMAEDGAERHGGNRWLAPTDYLAGGAMAAGAHGGAGLLSMLHPGVAATGILTAAAHKVARERGSAVLGSAAYQLSKLGTDQAVGEALAKVTGGIDKQITAAVDAAIGINSKAKSAEMPLLRPSGTYEKATAEVSRQATNPAAAAGQAQERIGQLANHVPATAAAVVQLQQQKAQYLQSKIPQATGVDGSIQPHFQQPRVSAGAQAQWLREKKLTDDPLHALDLLKKGELTRSDVQTVKATSPGIFKQMQSEGMRQVTEAKGRMSYQKLIQLGTLLEIPTTPSLQPQSIFANQQVFAEQAANGNGGPPKGHGKPIKDVATSTATATQALEER